MQAYHRFDPQSVPVLFEDRSRSISRRRHTSVSSCQYDCTNARYDLHLHAALSIRTPCDYPTRQCSSGKQGSWDKRTFIFVFKGSVSPEPKHTTCKLLFKLYIIHAFISHNLENKFPTLIFA